MSFHEPVDLMDFCSSKGAWKMFVGAAKANQH